ncbi:prolyl oligopeptidase family protein [Bdellovibrio sp. NC01]|uniref:prolyl oligopeptidase family serine peptidase n=1 Tax=Bdellovibrio sp. NC01 TaxID=2220073 RepID=UPI001FEE73CB|nr:prolyl oligopeptidase family serine peptidase [Bdellovibrio sp. NC01]
MRMKLLFVLATASLALTSCITKNAQVKKEPVKKETQSVQQDPYLYLEEVEGKKALEFAKAESKRTVAHFKKDPNFNSIKKDLTKIALADDRLPQVYLMNGEVYNFWQDKKHTRGIWRKTSVEEFKKEKPQWNVLLDLDALAKKENENWVWAGADCLPPKNTRCLISLSRGGKDAKVTREFDLTSLSFVKDGFFLPEAKSYATWIDQDTLYVGTDWGANSLTDSGYPMISKILKRGQALKDAKEVFQGSKKDMSASTFTYFTPKKNYIFHFRTISFYENEVWYEDEKGVRTLLPVPTSADFSGVFDDYFLFLLRDDLKTNTRMIPAGSLVALPAQRLKLKEKALDFLDILFTPKAKRFLSHVGISKTAIYLNLNDNVQGKVARITRQETGSWQLADLNLGNKGVARAYSNDAFDDAFLVNYTDFLSPSAIYLGMPADKNSDWALLKSAPPRFNSAEMTVDQKEAKSKDGTMIPYFIIHKKNMKLNEKNPTLMYGYGGFESPILPYYLDSIGKVWIERGGVFVVANIRGGGEFGPSWHQAVLRENRTKVYDDFIAVAEDLIKSKITNAGHLGIQGRSNGGLLTGATVVRRPDLFNAALVEVPLLDMLRYHKLLAGASWMEEYGNPDDAKMREAILQYSPYQNVKADKKYPEIFFMTSTKDDRVHPGHARKMVARMKEQGHKVYYYENTEGGHAGNANIKQKILWNTLEYTYLWQKLGPAPK